MSSLAVNPRRVKERGGASGRASAPKPSKPLTPISEKASSAGKENLRSTSASRASSVASQKMAVVARPVPIPRIDKSKEGGVRWSTSSIPRGRSSSPSDFSRFQSDRMSRVSSSDRSAARGAADRVNGERNVRSGCRVLPRSQSQKANGSSSLRVSHGTENGIRGLGDCKDNRVVVNHSTDYAENIGKCLSNDLKVSSENSTILSQKLLGVPNLRLNSEKEVVINLGSCKDKVGSDGSSQKRSDFAQVSESFKEKNGVNLTLKDDGVSQKSLDSSRVSEDIQEKNCVDLKVKDVVEGAVEVDKVIEESGDAICFESKGVKERTLSRSKVVENVSLKGKANGEENKGVRAINKYQSKLHEKLAYLEGKVKRIAYDIKRTKEMLDMNNPDSSKVVILDIQDKISGIEKAMGHVVKENPIGADSSEVPKNAEGDSQKNKSLETSQHSQTDHSKISVKGLSPEELEARLFPHHKLLKNRGSSNTSKTNSQECQSVATKASASQKSEDAMSIPIDENPIALEFLASLEKNPSKVSIMDEHANSIMSEIQEMDGNTSSGANDELSTVVVASCGEEIRLTTDETLDEFYDQENNPEMLVNEETEDINMDQLHEIGCKASTGGWFVSEGESVLLAHDDGSCTFYDIANCEEKNEYRPPRGVAPNIWGDCWLIRAPGADGCSGRYVVAASSGSTLESGFCSWDFYSKDVRAFHLEDEKVNSTRTVLGPLSNRGLYRRNVLPAATAPENSQWWYKPCGPLLVSAASAQNAVNLYDIRDGEHVMKWEAQKAVTMMDYSSPLHWRNRGKVVIAETEAITLWDVNSLNPQALLSVSLFGRKVLALHVHNTDAELGGGVRRRVSSSEVDGNDGVFCTQDSVNVLDFRLPSGVGLKISKLGVTVQSIFSRGDSVFLGCCDGRSAGREQVRSCIQQFSIRKGRLISTYSLPESKTHFHHSAISQVWGNSDIVMGVSGLGLFVFDNLQDDGMASFGIDHSKAQPVREIIGPDDLYLPSFDYLSSRVLVISRDRPALWRYLA
ncbi:hypothetical protein Sjap_006253 [Stephania japonica]|uniref:At4g14310 8-bladed propeller domain-containing protein n=1 Tax=Stephania japonica TaxID=461633 RepID=A0AAP0PLU1_9MAGN